MASIIPGYEYDIFISYRHKDNKYDGWVNSFVENLSKELDANFKEEISIYFDKNPHDGLLESHDVQASLKEKLKCLIFIPIVSRTYCDPVSFAWKNEFLAFRNLADRDSLGLKVKLHNGNVSSRILPVRIHDLEPEDVKLFEQESGSVLRPIDFVFATAGVNRPLLPNEDHPRDNQNKTYYRDQINKVVNSIREILDAARNPADTKNVATTRPIKTEKNGNKVTTRSWVAYTIIPVFLIASVMIWYFRPRNEVDSMNESLAEKISIAVIPFKNLNETRENEVICNSLAEDILTRLAGHRQLKVPSRMSSSAYRDSNKPARQISDELGVQYILEGSILANDNELQITARLIDAKADQIIWTKPFNRKFSDYFAVQGDVAQSVVASLPIDIHDNDDIFAGSERFDLKAYELYKIGLANFDRAETFSTINNIIPYFERALEIDSTLYPAYVGIANTYIRYNVFGRTTADAVDEKITFALEKCKRLQPNYPELHAAYASYALHFKFDGDQFLELISKARALNASNPEVYENMGYFYTITGNFQKAMETFDQAIEIDPSSKPYYLYHKAFAKYLQRDFTGALALIDQCLNEFPEYSLALWGKGLCLTQLNDYDGALKAFHSRSLGTYTNWAIANLYARMGKPEEVNKIKEYNIGLTKIRYVPPTVIAHLYLAAGEKDEACNWFKRQLDSGDGGIFWLYMIKLDPRMDELKGHPCYEEIQKKIPM